MQKLLYLLAFTLSICALQLVSINIVNVSVLVGSEHAGFNEAVLLRMSVEN